MVKTEFVWADGAEHDVKLSGAWNGWMPVQVSLCRSFRQLLMRVFALLFDSAVFVRRGLQLEIRAGSRVLLAFLL